MVIRINESQEVICQLPCELNESMKNNYTFEVENIPEKRPNEILCFNPETKEFYFKDYPPINEAAIKARHEKAITRKNAEAQKAHCLKWLADNDWKVNKRMLGEWSENDERWIQYLTDRRLIRAEYDAAVAQLEG